MAIRVACDYSLREPFKTDFMVLGSHQRLANEKRTFASFRC